jgi:hypothetical protein
LDLISEVSEGPFSQASQSTTTSTITTDPFILARASKRPLFFQAFDLIKFKRLLLIFIISNNLSFRIISSDSFWKLLVYLNKYVYY